jgi:hypothetical protein
MGAQRRAQAIATAPRRNRHDDEEEDIEQKKSTKILFEILSLSVFYSFSWIY